MLPIRKEHPFYQQYRDSQEKWAISLDNISYVKYLALFYGFYQKFLKGSFI
jgi:hypothetical protein